MTTARDLGIGGIWQMGHRVARHPRARRRDARTRLWPRVAAAGRAAFSNYLGTSIIMTTIFYGYGIGLFGEVSRSGLWMFVIGAWVIMLSWSEPWLKRFHYGPLEWLWRSFARGEIQTFRR